ncbi:MAG TPA: hypothetical protein VNF68_06300 [Candidatus Baltobacteraceae bacterium]|nr:hypothetical protein [Candidatus Baltobacteraceae bacterium]
MFKTLAIVFFVVAAAVPVAASAQNLYINLNRLRVEDKQLASGCELTVRTKYDGDKMRCTDQDGMSVYHWHKIVIDTMYGALMRTCELHVVKENHKAFAYRWHAVIYPGSAQCRMHWANDNTLDVEPGVR